MAYQFKIQIKGITKPPVWRRVVVPEDFSFFQFHYIIQCSFGWWNEHLFQFGDGVYEGNVLINIPYEDDLFYRTLPLNATKTKLSQIFAERFKKFYYIYDFGDDWVHTITLEDVVPHTSEHAICLAGKGTCPPEDCGGIYGYEELKYHFREKPNSKETNSLRKWLGMKKGELWNEKEPVDIEEINDMLKKITAEKIEDLL